ncbi:zinc finger CCCH domain-containing protein 27-like [Typha latifolia]|uniref:zinc finger CCCH domain-containing protein 27-like n=1 Tax=Typha latifolia TaxID=4733 RepID=UPI003C2C8B09
MLESSLSPAADTVQLRSSSSKEESNPENQEISDDEDDDRNHKHRRREVEPHSFDNNVIKQPLIRSNCKRNRPFENGKLLSGTDSQGEILEDYSPKFEKRRPGLMPLRASSELGGWNRVNQAYRSNPGPSLTVSASPAHPVGRGRGQNMFPWSQHDSGFNLLDTIDFASKMASQGLSTHPSLFVQTGLPSVSTQNSSWGAYGFVSGMTNRILDPLHSLGFHGALQPTINPLMNLTMAHQHCRDFEERGFCLRGDMCPMEHGVNRIVVEDVQSLSQFNFPSSVPNSHALGFQAEADPPIVSASSGLLTNRKALPEKDIESGVTIDGLKLSGDLSTTAVAEADVYDPDQPLWNNEHPETSPTGLKLTSPSNINELVGDANSSVRQDLRLCDDIESECQSGRVAVNVVLESTDSSIWGQTTSGSKSEAEIFNTRSCPRNKMKVEGMEATPVTIQGKSAAMREMTLMSTDEPHSRLHADLGQYCASRTSQKASRSLYVNGIPKKNNRKIALLSHFQKFGEVIDIYIPLNSEKAFVQFSKREEAEAALKAPDAVMGNRFIRLWWADRDRISDDGESRVHSKLPQLANIVGHSIPHQPFVSDREKRNLQSAGPKSRNACDVETSVPAVNPPKTLAANGQKAAPPVQKKLESLELLEELRKRQELLAQKRDEFRRQLDKFEKQATSVKKGETTGKGRKMDMPTETVKAAAPEAINCSAQGIQQEDGSILERRNAGDTLVSPNSKANLTRVQQSPRTTRQTNCLPSSQNRFKLDNHPTSFRILPPLPAEIADVAVMKDHFSSFGDLTSVALENSETLIEGASLKSSQCCSACVTFSTRQSAERAYAAGKCLQGHNLQFMWLIETAISKDNTGVRKTSIPMGTSNVEIQAEQVTDGSSSSNIGKSACSAISNSTASRNDESMLNAKSVIYASITFPKDIIAASSSSPPLSLCKERFADCDVLEDGK